MDKGKMGVCKWSDIIKQQQQFIGMIDRNDLPPEPEEY
jgi:hypothetical protein